VHQTSPGTPGSQRLKPHGTVRSLHLHRAGPPHHSSPSGPPETRGAQDQEGPITTDIGRTNAKASSWTYCEEFVPEDDVLLRARERAAELGCPAVLPGTGAVLQALAAALAARAVVEIGTGTGVASLWLLRGMPEDGVLTTIDVEVEHQRAAKEAFSEAGIRGTRTRTIPGRASDVLPRLTDDGLDGRERPEVVAQEGLRTPLVHARAVGELPPVRSDLDGQVGEEGRGAPDAVGPRPPLGQAREERQGRDARGHLGEVPEDGLLRLEDVRAFAAGPRPVPAD